MEENKHEQEVISASSLELIQRAEIDMQIATAKRYPRDLARVKRRMLDFATLDEETAESCFYSVPRDGKTIQGPSVRLAEIAVACYQNLRAASRVIDNNGKILTSQAACHDLENNTLISVEVQRRITNKQGKTYSEDMQVTAGNAANAIAFRNAVFKVIPGALVKPVYEAAKAVAVGNASTLVVKRDKMIKRLNSMQVDTPRILAKLGKSSVENIGLEDLEVLIGLGTAIKDGDTSVDEAFPPLEKVNPKTGETDAQRDARQQEQMDRQARDGSTPERSKETGPDYPSHENQDTGKKESEPTASGRWPNKQVMLDAFAELYQSVGEEQFMRVIGSNGIDSVEALSMSDPVTGKAFDELKSLQADHQKDAPAPESKEEPKPQQSSPAAGAPVHDKPTFGQRRNR